MPIALLILLSSLLNAMGWLLSFIGQLSKAGYLAFALLITMVLLLNRQRWYGLVEKRLRSYAKYRARIRNPFRLAFLVCVALIFVRASFFEPFNGDAFAYRIPRMLHWIEAQQWHWIFTDDLRLNVRGVAYEWSGLPFLLFTGSPNSTIVFNFLGYLCLPGMFFGVFRRIGMPGRVAWYWMWLSSSAYIVIFQAGDTGSDLTAAIYALAALFFALRACETRKFSDAVLAVLSAALMTGVKQTTLPLLLPWIVAIAPGWRIFYRNIWGTIALLLFAGLISAIPISYFNWKYTGDWTGLVSEPYLPAAFNPFLGFAGNTVHLLIQNFTPPYVPYYTAMEHYMESWRHTSLGQITSHYFEPPYPTIFKRDQGDSLGLIFSAMLTFSALYRIRHYTLHSKISTHVKWLGCSIVIAWIFLLCKNNAAAVGRMFLSYIFYLIPFLLLHPSQLILIRKKWWRILALLVIWHAAFMLLFFFPNAPAMACFFPKQYIHGRLSNADLAAWVNPLIPLEEHTVGIMRTMSNAEAWLWEPYGSRKVICLPIKATDGDYEKNRIRWIVIADYALKPKHLTVEECLRLNNCELVSTHEDIADWKWYLARRK